MAAPPQVIVGASVSRPGDVHDPASKFSHLDIEMSGRLGSDAYRFCDVFCSCRKKRNTSGKSTGDPFKFTATGLIDTSDPSLLFEALQRINRSYNSAVPCMFSTTMTTLLGSVAPLLGVLLLIAGLIQGAATETLVTRLPLVWIGIALVAVGVVWIVVLCFCSATWTMAKPFHAVHEMCQVINEEVKRENIRLDFLMFNNIEYVLAINGRHTYSSKFYNTYLLRITDYKKPANDITIQSFQPPFPPPPSALPYATPQPSPPPGAMPYATSAPPAAGYANNSARPPPYATGPTPYGTSPPPYGYPAAPPPGIYQPPPEQYPPRQGQYAAPPY